MSSNCWREVRGNCPSSHLVLTPRLAENLAASSTMPLAPKISASAPAKKKAARRRPLKITNTHMKEQVCPIHVGEESEVEGNHRGSILRKTTNEQSDKDDNRSTSSYWSRWVMCSITTVCDHPEIALRVDCLDSETIRPGWRWLWRMMLCFRGVIPRPRTVEVVPRLTVGCTRMYVLVDPM